MDMDAPSTQESMVALMGPTGTGKSSFINLLTNDANIHVGHDLQSQTFDVATARWEADPEEDRPAVILVDTPGFDDSREGVSDTDILGRIAGFLQEGGGRVLNGVIYLHRISDPRLGGQAKKNLKVFKELCGDSNLRNVCIVTTYWDRVDEQEGSTREAALASGAFKPLLDAGARLVRHDKEWASAHAIVAALAREQPVVLKIQEELNGGTVLGETSAGAVIIEEMQELRKKHERDVADLKKEIEEAANANDEDLRAEIDMERRKLEDLMLQVEADRKRLQTTRMAPETGSTSNGGIPKPVMRSQSEKTKQKASARPSRSQRWADTLAEVSQEEYSTRRKAETVPSDTAPLLDNGRPMRHARRRDRAREDRGLVLSDLMRDMINTIRDYGRVGGQHLGTLGVIAGVVLGLVVVYGMVFATVVCLLFSLAVTAKQTIFDRR